VTVSRYTGSISSVPTSGSLPSVLLYVFSNSLFQGLELGDLVYLVILGVCAHSGLQGFGCYLFWTKSVQVPVVTFENLMAPAHDTFIRHLKQSEAGWTENP
jgi:hypothetical protein